MPNRTLVVFTFRPISLLLSEGGSQAWALKPANARRCAYIVCTRNRYHEGAGPEEHGAAFLVGKVSAVEVSPETADRYIVRFGEYAVLDFGPVIWPGARNPVWYVDDIRQLGIDPDALQWQSIPKRTSGSTEIAEQDGVASDGLTFDEARVGISLRYRVPPEAVEILIRG